MSTGLAALVFLIITIGVAIGCWASYHEGRFNGYLKGYDDGWKAERKTVSHRLNRALYQALEQGLVTHTAINRLYERTREQIRNLDPGNRPFDGGGRP